ncbi:MAG: prepilin-type N-terminal cleavage/methylation domain-containing protein [Candidatus Buchananbacteria bacterium]
MIKLKFLKIKLFSAVKHQRGFTLLEAMLYLTIVSIILVSISYLMLDVMAGQSKSYAGSEVNYNVRFITNLLTKDIRSAKEIVSLDSENLVLTQSDGSVTYNFDPTAKILTRQVASQTPEIINTNRVEVLGSFVDLSYLGRTKNIGVSLKIIYKNPGNLPDYNASTTAEFSTELRGRR